MQDKSRFQITSKQAIFMIIGATISTGILSLPRVTTADAGQDGWLSIILGSCVPLLSLLLIERLGRRFPDLTIVEIASQLFGKLLGYVLIALFVAYLIFFESVVLRIGAEVTSMFALPRTPVSIIALLMIISIIYIAQKGAKAVGRLNELLFYIFILDLLLFLPPLKVADYTNLLPVAGAGLTAVAKGALPTAYAFQGIEILFMIYCMVTRKDEVLKAGVTALGIILFVYLMVTVICLLVFGAEVLQQILLPGIVLLKVVDIPVIERLEFFFLAFWIGLVSRPVINMCLAVSFSLTRLFKLDMEKYYSLTVIVVGIFIYIFALIPDNIVEVYKYSTYVGYGFFIAGIGYPVLFNFAAFLRKGKIKQHD